MLLLVSLVLSMTIGAIAREPVQDIQHFQNLDIVPETIMVEVVHDYVRVVAACGTVLNTYSFAEVMDEYSVFMRDLNWDGTIVPLLSWLSHEYSDRHPSGCCRNIITEHDIDKPVIDITITIERLYFETEPRVVITDSYGVVICLTDDRITPDVLDMVHNATTDFSNTFLSANRESGVAVFSACRHNNRERVLSHVVPQGPTAASCWRRVYRFILNCTDCGQVGVGHGEETISQTHNFQPNPQGRLVCTHCTWIR